MATKRKGISKKTRFEVFKRDSFKCQYCGKTAPDTILVVDHIVPVKDGGDNELTNLVTACDVCNQGKGARSLDDNTVVEKQRKQMEELNERREQLEMMMKWRTGLNGIEQDKIDAVAEYWINKGCHSLNEHGLNLLSKNIKKYGMEQILDAMDKAVEQYVEYDDDGNVTHKSVERAFRMVERIANMFNVKKEKPYIQDLFYLRAILRNRLNIPKETYLQSVNNRIIMAEALKLIEKVYLSFTLKRNRSHEDSISAIKDDILGAEDYDEFVDIMGFTLDWIEMKCGEGNEWQEQETSSLPYL